MPNSHSENTKRIAKNTVFLTGRMLFSLLVSLYTSRVILQALGVDDYGIYGVVGGLVTMFSIVSGSIQASINRFITYELGINDADRLQKTFSTAFMVQAILAVIVLALGETIGVWFLNTHMVIPADRLFAANVVFQSSIFSFMLGLVLMPYSACINAHEHMDVFAYLGIFDIVLKLGIVLFVAYCDWHFDKLIVYSILIVVSGIIMQILSVGYCRRYFTETQVKWRIDRAYMKQMGNFAGWNFIGASAALLRDAGGNILLNLFFGPAVNAARSVAGSVSSAVCGFSNNFMAAINPQITKSYASKDNSYMMSLLFRSSRFSFYVILLVGLPIIFNTSYILNLWLTTVPDYSAIFVKLTIIFALIESISNPLITAQLATGNIKKYQLGVGGLQMLNLPLAYAALKLFGMPYMVYVVAITLSILCLCARVYFLHDMIGLPIKEFVSDVVANLLLVTAASVILPLCALAVMTNDLGGFIFSTILCLISSLVCIAYIGMKGNERMFITSRLTTFFSKFSSKCCR